MSDFDFLNGEVSEPTTYTPVPTAHYLAKAVKLEMVDPETVFGPPRDGMTPKQVEDYLRPFIRIRWQIKANEAGEATEYAGRMVDLRVDLRSGPDPKTGQSLAKVRADLLRVANGLKAADEPLGLKLIEVPAGLDKAESLAIANEQLKKYEGLEAVIAVREYTRKSDGEKRELVGGIIVPKE